MKTLNLLEFEPNAIKSCCRPSPGYTPHNTMQKRCVAGIVLSVSNICRTTDTKTETCRTMNNDHWIKKIRQCRPPEYFMMIIIIFYSDGVLKFTATTTTTAAEKQRKTNKFSVRFCDYDISTNMSYMREFVCLRMTDDVSHMHMLLLLLLLLLFW